MIGSSLSHYTILRRIGAGGMGVVYLARDEHLHCEVALKVLTAGHLADDLARQRFRREARMLASRNHPNIVTVHDFDTQEGLDFLIMEYVDGPTLTQVLAQGRLAERRILDLGAQLARGLEAAHEVGVIHRDVKAGNLKITRDEVLKILDFGLAKRQALNEETRADEPLTELGHQVGTLAYMAPEQLHGAPADVRSDLYSAGVVLYQMATGRLPHEGSDPWKLFEAIATRVPPPPSRWNPELSSRLEAVIARAMEKDPSRRFASARELLEALDGTARVAVKRRSLSARLRRLWMVPAGIALSLVLVFAISGSRDRVASLFGLAPSPAEASIAVLPLQNLSNDPEQEYFADGMTEELITTLAQIQGLQVISRTSVMAFKGTDRSLHEIAQKLGVKKLVEGSVLRSGSRVRITAQLVDAVHDRHLWAKSYERELSDALALQSDVASAISEEIHVALTPRQAERFRRTPAVQPAAHEAYLRGLMLWNRREAQDIIQGIALFEEAIRLDPSFAKPHAALANAYALLGNLGVMPQSQAYGSARAEALRALALDPALGEAHAAIAEVKLEYEWDWAGSEREFRRAITLNPGDATAHQWYADYLSRMGRHPEALREIQRALALDPLSPPVNGMLGTVAYYGRRTDDAIRQYQATLALMPDQLLTRFYLGLAYLDKKDYPEAITEFERCVRESGAIPLTRAGLGCAYGMAGKRDEALRILASLKRHAPGETVAPSWLALVCIGLGDRDQALGYIEEAYRERDSYLGHIKVAPIVDPLRSDLRFLSILRRLGLDGPPV